MNYTDWTKEQLIEELERLAPEADRVGEMRDWVLETYERLDDWLEALNMLVEHPRDWISSYTEALRLSNELDRLTMAYNDLAEEVNAGRRRAELARGPGRPLEASEAQIEQVRHLRTEGGSLRSIAARTGLSMQTVRSVLNQPLRQRRQLELVRRREFNREAAQRYRERLKQAERLAGRGEAALKVRKAELKRGKKLLKG